MKKYMLWIALGVIVVCVALALLPFLQKHSNPPVVQEPNWDSPQTRELAKRACFDCHSNETTWPWYANILPVSVLIGHDVKEGRSVMNFSDWQAGERELEEVSGVVREGEMPPVYYTMLHPTAKLSEVEKETLIRGLQATMGASGGATGDLGEDGTEEEKD